MKVNRIESLKNYMNDNLKMVMETQRKQLDLVNRLMQITDLDELDNEIYQSEDLFEEEINEIIYNFRKNYTELLDEVWNEKTKKVSVKNA